MDIEGKEADGLVHQVRLYVTRAQVSDLITSCPDWAS